MSNAAEEPQTHEPTVAEQRAQRRQDARTQAIRRQESNSGLLDEFQPDAVEIEKRSVPGGARWTLYTVVALIAAVVAWSCWAEVDRIVTAQGKLITTEQPVVIQTVVTTPIRTMNAKFGDYVQAGDVLATMDPTFSEADLKQLRSQIDALDSQIARLVAEKDGVDFAIDEHASDPDWLLQRQVFLERENQLTAKLAEFDAELRKLEVQQENNAVEIEQKKEAYRDYREYEKTIEKLANRGSKTEEDMLNRRLQSGQAKMDYLNARSRDKELQREIESVRAQREAHAAQWRSELVTRLAEASQKRRETGEELSKATRSNELIELKVPEDLPYKQFVVFEVAERTVGSVLKPSEPLYRLVPIDVPLEAEVEIEGRDISRIQAASESQIDGDDFPNGSLARVKLASFPYQRHGTIDGAVRAISYGSFEKQNAAGGSTGATLYKARIQLLNPEALENVPENFQLMPGMTTTVEIRVGSRQVIEYFLYPLLRYMDESIREP